jgi:flagellar capping protein FliD
VGIAERIFDAVDALDDVGTGALAIRSNGLTKEVKEFSDQITKMEEDLVRFEEQQRIKFANLDGLLKNLQSQLDILNTRL